MQSLLTGLFVPRQVGWILARRLLQFTTFRVARKHPLSISGQSVEGLLHNPRVQHASSGRPRRQRRVKDVHCSVSKALGLLL